MAWRPEESPIISRTTERTLHGYPGIYVPSTQLNYKQAPLETRTSGKTGEPPMEVRRDKIIKAASARGEGKIRGGTEKERITK